MVKLNKQQEVFFLTREQRKFSIDRRTSRLTMHPFLNEYIEEPVENAYLSQIKMEMPMRIYLTSVTSKIKNP
jgi:hypothetical protein